MYTRAHTHTRTRPHRCTHAAMHIHTRVHECAGTDTRADMCVHTRVCICADTRAHTHTHPHRGTADPLRLPHWTCRCPVPGCCPLTSGPSFPSWKTPHLLTFCSPLGGLGGLVTHPRPSNSNLGEEAGNTVQFSPGTCHPREPQGRESGSLSGLGCHPASTLARAPRVHPSSSFTLSPSSPF